MLRPEKINLILSSEISSGPHTMCYRSPCVIRRKLQTKQIWLANLFNRARFPYYYYYYIMLFIIINFIIYAYIQV